MSCVFVAGRAARGIAGHAVFRQRGRRYPRGLQNSTRNSTSDPVTGFRSFVCTM